MGSSKRHKTEKTRESKKRRHRSRSRSHSVERERVDKHRHHKKHKRKERKEYDSDVEIVSAPPPPKISKTSHLATPPPPEISKQKSPSPIAKGSSSEHALSIEETNRMRAKLGLKPLALDSGPKDDKKEDSKIKDDLGEFYHKPAQNTSEKNKTDKIKERLAVQKQKRHIEANLSRVKTLGESDSDDDAKAWVTKNRKISEEKRKAEERAKMLDQLDEEFGIGNLVEEEVRNERKKAYTERDLKGLRVEHNVESFEDGSSVILTLKDKEVLNNDDDVLINVNFKDDERYKKNLLVKSKKPTYSAYDEDDLDENGMSRHEILTKYDEEIDGEKQESFALGTNEAKDMKQRKAELIKNRLANKRLETLQYKEPKIASQYLTEADLKFKKTKKKVRKIRTNKILKADDLITDSSDYLHDLGCRRRKHDQRKAKKENVLDVDDIGAPSEDLSNVKLEEEDKSALISTALKKYQRLKQPVVSSIEKIAESVKQEVEKTEYRSGTNIVLDQTAEFCRTLGDIPTYGLAGNREDNDQEMMDFEVDEVKNEEDMDEEENDGRGAWNTVQLDQNSTEPVTLEAAILDAEPSLDQGVGGALKLAMSKGYLQKEDSNRPSASRFAHLHAQHYSIEDKTYGDDDKFGRRDRFNGPTSEFKEKDGFKPNVKLEYIDDDGHVLSSKEAFRYLSHKFHGKGPGKNKVEKRMKKAEQEVLMKRMSSTDTPLGTLTLLQAKQKETQSPFIVLSGSKQMQTTTISKH